MVRVLKTDSNFQVGHASRPRQRLALNSPLGLLGPRQVGKSTWAQTIAQEAAGAAERLDYLDLENPADQSKLEDAGAYLRARGPAGRDR